MRRIFGLVIALLIPTAVIGAVALAVYRPGPPEMARITLDRYLNRLRQEGRPASVRALSRASHPLRFTAALSGPAYGDDIYYNVSADATPIPVTPDQAWFSGAALTETVALTPQAGGTGGQRPLPYPPEALWCVQLQPEGAAATVVLLALHQDLYNASWAIHELPPAAAAQTLAQVGCAAR